MSDVDRERLAKELETDFERNPAGCSELDAAGARRPGVRPRVRDSVARRLSPLL